VLKDNYKKLVFLVGGIGITPVISMIEYVVDKNIEIDTILFYSNKHDDDIAFRKELDYWEMSLKIRIFYIVTDCQPTDRRCFFGSINEGLLKEKIDDLDERIFFIFGPPKMVDAMSEVCKKLSCRNDNIRKESFIGY
jgi:ferredoxin-NADP reductase